MRLFFYAHGMKIKKYFLSLFALPIFCFAQEEPINPALLGLGQAFFFDKSLSYNKTQSCSTCHMPEAAFTDLRENDIDKMVSQGDDPTKFGNRNTPTAIMQNIPQIFISMKKLRIMLAVNFGMVEQNI